MTDQNSVSGWQPISTNPRIDDAPFIGAFRYEETGEWEVHEYEWSESRGFFLQPYNEMPDEDLKLTHWRPMPSPPATPNT